MEKKNNIETLIKWKLENPEKVKEANGRSQKKRWSKVVMARGHIRPTQKDEKKKESMRLRNKRRYEKNKITGKYKKIIKKQNERIKKQYNKYL